MDHAHDLTLYAAAGVIAAGPFAATALDRWRGWMILGRQPTVDATAALRAALALLSLGAGAIHLAVMGDHFEVGLLTGLLIAAVGWLQVLSGVVYGAGRLVLEMRVALGAVAVNGATILAWIASRTVGVPAPIGEGHAEPVGAADLLATLFELGIVIGLVSLIAARQRPSRWRVSSSSGSLAVIALGVAVVVLTTAAIAQGTHHH